MFQFLLCAGVFQVTFAKPLSTLYGVIRVRNDPTGCSGAPTGCSALVEVSLRSNSRVLPRLASPRTMFCASHRTVVMAVAKSWQKLDLSVPRRFTWLVNPVAGRGHHRRRAGGDLRGQREPLDTSAPVQRCCARPATAPPTVPWACETNTTAANGRGLARGEGGASGVLA